jgi:hypothetical protein
VRLHELAVHKAGAVILHGARRRGARWLPANQQRPERPDVRDCTCGREELQRLREPPWTARACPQWRRRRAKRGSAQARGKCRPPGRRPRPGRRAGARAPPVGRAEHLGSPWPPSRAEEGRPSGRGSCVRPRIGEGYFSCALRYENARTAAAARGVRSKASLKTARMSRRAHPPTEATTTAAGARRFFSS